MNESEIFPEIPDQEPPAEEIAAETAAEEAPVEESATEEMPAEAPVEESATEEMPAEAPVEESAAKEMPVEAPVEESAAEEMLEETTPSTDATDVPPVMDAYHDFPEAKKGKNGIWLVIGIIAVSISLLIGAFAIWVVGNDEDGLKFPQSNTQNNGSDGSFNIPQSNTPSYQYRDDVTAEDQLTPQEIIAKVSPSVVVVSVEGTGVSGFGTGFIYTDNGYILTNAHVVDDATRITVTDYYGKTYAATLIGADDQSDVAVIKINATGLKAVEFGQSSSVVPGDTVIAIGTPYAEELSFTATQGMVSAIRKDLNFSNLGYTLDLIQHDAPINSGNSGGPLINVYGQVIGINSIKISGSYENLGFALQIDDVLPLAEKLMSNGKITRPAIGIKANSAAIREGGGVEISEVTPGGSAEKAGLKAGDVIMKLNDVQIKNFATLRKAIQSHNIGDTVQVTYLRDGEEFTVSLVLGILSE